MSRPRRSSISPWSIKIATVAGIPVRLHVTFLFFLVWLGMLAANEKSRDFAFLVPSIFFCVILHEFGHAMVARAYGIKTRDVTLYPIGGIAMLESRPKPNQELWIALAGPMVNVVIAAILYPVIIAVEGKPPDFSGNHPQTTYLQGLFAANVILPLFNMVPALPMDGGRVLRALLAMRLPEVRATQIAGNIAQLTALAVIFWALLQQDIFLAAIAFLVFIGAGQEVQTSVGMALVEGRRVSDAMVSQFETLSSGASLSQAAELLLKVSQPSFPVVVGDEVLGLLTREGIVSGLSREGPSGYVAGHMNRDFARLTPEQPLEDALQALAKGNGQPALVFDGENLVGMVTAENLAEFMMVQQALRRR